MLIRPKLRRIIWPLVSVTLVVGALWLTLLSPPVLTWLVRWGLERSTGTTVQVKDARWDGWGRLSVESVRVLAPGWPGRSAELFTLEGLVSTFNPMGLLLARLDLEDLDIEHASLRVAQREGGSRPEDTNLSAIHPPQGGVGLSLSIRPQRIRVGDLSIENLSLKGDTLTARGERAFRGLLDRKPGAAPGDLAFRLVEVQWVSDADRRGRAAPPEIANGVQLEGVWNDETYDWALTANRLDFNDSVRPLLPLALQESCRALGLTGTVSDISLRGSPAKPLAEASLKLRDIAVNLLEIGLPTQWESFSEGARGRIVGRPRMAVERGTIELKDDRLTLRDLSGRLESVGQASGATATPAVPLPAALTIQLDFSRIPPPTNIDQAKEWFDTALLHCGVSIDFAVPEFALRRQDPVRPWSVELPSEIVNILDNFKVRQGVIRIAAKAQREASVPGASESPFDVSGTLRIEDGEGSYVNFDYPLHDVAAEIAFAGDRLQVRSLKAAGSEGCRMMISGAVDGAGDDAGVDLTILTETEAPIDLALQNAFDPGPRRMFELLFARDLRERLVEAGLLAADAAPLGGHCRFEIRVQRDRGARNVATTGWISVRDASVLCSRFPYPIQVERGRIELDDEAIRLPRGSWLFRTAGGGGGTIDGQIAIPRRGAGRDALPDLDLRVSGDRINPLLLAAIPLESAQRRTRLADGWPGRVRSVAADAMRAVGLDGEIAVTGRIGSDPAGDTTLDLDIPLVHGSFRPRNGPERLLERVGVPWPEGFDLDDVAARVHLTEREATLISLSARAGQGSVRAEGSASLVEMDRALHAQLSGAPLGLWIVPLLPDRVQASAREAWERCRVEGSFDGDILLRQRDGGRTERRATLATSGVRLSARGTPCELRVPCGHFSIDGPTLELVDVQVQALADGARVGELEADGDIALAPDGRQSLQGSWRLDEVASNLWPVMLEAADLADIARLHDRWNPTGAASGSVTVARSPEKPIDWQVQVGTGTEIRADPAGVPLLLRLADDGRLGLGPGLVSLHGSDASGAPGLVGAVAGGAFALDGVLATGPGGPADGGSMRLSFEVGPIHPEVTNVLPADLAAGLRHIDLAASQASAEDLELLGWTANAPSFGLRGGVLLNDASLDAGTRLSRIHARFGIDARTGRPDPVVIELGGGEGTFMAKDRVFDDAGGRLIVSEGTRRIRIEDLQASLYGGRAWASADIGGATRAWRLDVGVSGAGLPGLVRGGATTQSFANAGEVDGALSLGGELGTAGSLRGTGRISARDARMAELPLTLRLLQATQLMLPLSDSLDQASIAFHLRGDQLRFDRLDLTCLTLKLLGAGTMNLSDWTVALRFRNRGTVPLLSDMFGAASDALFVIDVSGPAGDPEVKLTPLPPLGQDPSSPNAPPQVTAARTETP